MVINKISAPKWMIFIIDVFISVCATIVAYFLRFNFNIPQVEIDSLYLVLPYVVIIRSITFYVGRTFVGIIRFTGTSDIIRIANSVTVGTLIFCLTNGLTYAFLDKVFIIPFSIIIIDFMATMFIMISYRFFIKLAHIENQNKSKERNKIIIYGAGESGVISKRTLDRDA
ncbi:MAG: hypothetical protein RIC15_04265, partial [Vicingaceae bacterium]